MSTNKRQEIILDLNRRNENMETWIKEIIDNIKKNEWDQIHKTYRTEIVFYTDNSDYKEIWVKPNLEKQEGVKNPFNYYWFHLYKYIEIFEKPHVLLIHGRMGNTTETKIFKKET